MQKLINDTQNVTEGAMDYLVWQEVIDNNVVLPSETVVHVWKDGMDFARELARVNRFINFSFFFFFFFFKLNLLRSFSVR